MARRRRGLSNAQGFPAVASGDRGFTTPAAWHYAADVLAVEFWSDLDLSAGILPKGIELDARSGGRSTAIFADCQFTANGEEYLDPACYQSREFIVLLDATWHGSQIAWCPYAYTDNDATIMMCWDQGYPKKFREGRFCHGPTVSDAIDRLTA